MASTLSVKGMRRRDAFVLPKVIWIAPSLTFCPSKPETLFRTKGAVYENRCHITQKHGGCHQIARFFFPADYPITMVFAGNQPNSGRARDRLPLHCQIERAPQYLQFTIDTPDCQPMRQPRFNILINVLNRDVV